MAATAACGRVTAARRVYVLVTWNHSACRRLGMIMAG